MLEKFPVKKRWKRWRKACHIRCRNLAEVKLATAERLRCKSKINETQKTINANSIIEILAKIVV